jgi:hypothetical protein
MKATFIISIIFLALINGVYQYSIKKDFRSTELDKYVFWIQGLDTFLPKGTQCKFSFVDAHSDMHVRVRYLLAPRNILIDRNAPTDTILTISSIKKKDSLFAAFSAHGNTVLWQNQDTSYCFILTTNHK